MATGWRSITGPFDAIVSNPPYIPAQDPHLAALTHEPLSALASGADGLADIRAIIAQAPRALAPGRLAADRAWLGSGASRAKPAACRGPCPAGAVTTWPA